jgi:hypothetical protein
MGLSCVAHARACLRSFPTFSLSHHTSPSFLHVFSNQIPNAAPSLRASAVVRSFNDSLPLPHNTHLSFSRYLASVNRKNYPTRPTIHPSTLCRSSRPSSPARRMQANWTRRRSFVHLASFLSTFTYYEYFDPFFCSLSVYGTAPLACFVAFFLLHFNYIRLT